MIVRQRLKEDLAKAMKARDTAAVTAIRTLLGEIDNAEAIEVPEMPVPMQGQTKDVPRKELTEADIQHVLQSQAAGYRAAIAEYAALDRTEKVVQLQAELDVVVQYLE